MAQLRDIVPGSDAQRELDRASERSGAARQERLVVLSQRYPNHAPIWAALAEHHVLGRRWEEVERAARRALDREPGLWSRFSPELKHACIHLKPRNREPNREAEVAARARMPVAANEPSHTMRVGKLLARALDMRNRNERLAMIEQIRKIAPESPAVLFHVAIELALAGRNDEARRAGAELRQISPSRYKQLYDLAQTYWPNNPGRVVPSGPVPAWAPVSAMAPVSAVANDRTVLVRLPKRPAQPPVVTPRPAMQMQVTPAPAPKKTQLLSLPLPPVVQVTGASLALSTTGRPKPSGWRAAGAVIAGIAAGLLLAFLLVLVLGRTTKVLESKIPLLDSAEPITSYSQSVPSHMVAAEATQ